MKDWKRISLGNMAHGEGRGLTHLQGAYLQLRITVVRTMKNSVCFQGCIFKQENVCCGPLLTGIPKSEWSSDLKHDWRKDHVFESWRETSGGENHRSRNTLTWLVGLNTSFSPRDWPGLVIVNKGGCWQTVSHPGTWVHSSRITWVCLSRRAWPLSWAQTSRRSRSGWALRERKCSCFTGRRVCEDGGQDWELEGKNGPFQCRQMHSGSESAWFKKRKTKNPSGPITFKNLHTFKVVI